jgi:hypothetical protein
LEAAVILPENSTDMTLTSGSALGMLGITVSPTGKATLDTSGQYPVAMFPITGGFENADGSLVIEHDGSDLALTKGMDTVDIGDYGVSAGGPIALFGLAKGSTDFIVTLTAGAAKDLDKVFDTRAFSASTIIGTAVTHPVIASAVPEPSTWVMLCGGFGAFAVAAFRRRKRDDAWVG